MSFLSLRTQPQTLSLRTIASFDVKLAQRLSESLGLGNEGGSLGDRVITLAEAHKVLNPDQRFRLDVIATGVFDQRRNNKYAAVATAANLLLVGTLAATVSGETAGFLTTVYGVASIIGGAIGWGVAASSPTDTARKQLAELAPKPADAEADADAKKAA